MLCSHLSGGSGGRILHAVKFLLTPYLYSYPLSCKLGDTVPPCPCGPSHTVVAFRIFSRSGCVLPLMPPPLPLLLFFPPLSLSHVSPIVLCRLQEGNGEDALASIAGF